MYNLEEWSLFWKTYALSIQINRFVYLTNQRFTSYIYIRDQADLVITNRTLSSVQIKSQNTKLYQSKNGPPNPPRLYIIGLGLCTAVHTMYALHKSGSNTASYAHTLQRSSVVCTV